MDSTRFDRLTRILAAHTSRRGALKGLLTIGGGLVAAVQPSSSEAGWSATMCFGNTLTGFRPRLVPRAAIPYYLLRGARLPPDPGVCLSCTPQLTCETYSCGSFFKFTDDCGSEVWCEGFCCPADAECDSSIDCCGGICCGGVCCDTDETCADVTVCEGNVCFTSFECKAR